MNPVLISTDTHRISREKKFLDANIAIFQGVYDALSALSIDATLTEINQLLIFSLRGNHKSDFLMDYVVNKLLDAAAPYNLNGVELSREAVKSMLAIPDLSAVKASFISFNNLVNSSGGDGVNGVRIGLITLTNGVVAKSNTAYTAIETEFSYYTNTDASAALANSLQSVCDAMNTHNAANANMMIKDLIGTQEFAGQGETPLPGIAVFAGQFVPALNYIRSFERKNAN